MSTTNVRKVHCPKCAAEYKLRADYSGRVKCKKCSAAFTVGTTQAERRGAKSRDANDHKAAVKLFVIGGVVLLLIALIVLMANNSSTGGKGSGSGGLSKPARRTGSGLSAANREAARKNRERQMANLPPSPHPKIITEKFVRALAEGDKDTVKKWFDFDRYFDKIDLEFANQGEDAYKNMSSEAKAERREMVVNSILDSETGTTLKSQLIPALNSGDDSVWSKQTLRNESANYQFQINDNKRTPLMVLSISLRLRQGLDPVLDHMKEDSWRVYEVRNQWLQSSLTVAKAEKKTVDMGLGRKYKREIKRKKAGAKGPAEADPSRQDSVPGTPPEQETRIASHIAKLVDPNTSGPNYFEAQDKLEAEGKNAIPHLLNTLLDKNHSDDDDQIRAAFASIQILQRITGNDFGYRPGKAGGPMESMASATGEQRTTAVRRWFGWWKHNKTSFTKREMPEDEEEEDGQLR